MGKDRARLLVNYAAGRAEIDAEHYDVRELTDPNELEMAQRIIRLHHYAHRLPCKTNWRWYGLFHDQHPDVGPLNSVQGGLLGICVFGETQAARDGFTKALKESLPADKFDYIQRRGGTTELTRLWVAEKVPHKAAGKLVKEARQMVGYGAFVSFADTKQDHNGKIYQTTGFAYTGLTSAVSDPTLNDGRHHGSIDRGLTRLELEEKYGDDLSWEKRSRKHRWLWFTEPKIRAAFFQHQAQTKGRWRKRPVKFLGD